MGGLISMCYSFLFCRRTSYLDFQETREAFQWLHQKYYRIREEYEQAKNRAERSPNIDRQK